jgi:two-component system sensor histidine kinase KdpD
MDRLEVGRPQRAALGRLVRGTARMTSRRAAAKRLAGHAWAAAGSVAITLATTPLHGLLDLTNIVMLYLLGMVGVAYRSGRGPAALAAVLNVARIRLLLRAAAPVTFAVSDVQYLVTFAVMLLVGLLTGQLTAGLRFQARISGSRERRAQIAVRAHARSLRRAAERPGG